MLRIISKIAMNNYLKMFLYPTCMKIVIYSGRAHISVRGGEGGPRVKFWEVRVVGGLDPAMF